MKVKRIHFVCRDDLNVRDIESGAFVSGYWKVGADVALSAEFLALHQSKNEPSYRQGRIIARDLVDYESGKRYVLQFKPVQKFWTGKVMGLAKRATATDDYGSSFASSFTFGLFGSS